MAFEEVHDVSEKAAEPSDKAANDAETQHNWQYNARTQHHWRYTYHNKPTIIQQSRSNNKRTNCYYRQECQSSCQMSCLATSLAAVAHTIKTKIE